MVWADLDPSLLVFVLVTWPIYILPGLVTVPALFWREGKLPWTLPDVIIVVGPWIIWAFVYISTPGVERKLIHAVIESFVMGCTVPIGLGAIIVGKGWLPAISVRIGILVASALLSVVLCTWFFRVVD